MKEFKIAAAALALALAYAQPARAVATLDLSAANVSSVAPGAPVTVTLNWTLSEAVSLQGLTVNIDWPASGLTFEPAASTALGQSWADFTALFADPVFSTPLTITPGHIGGSALLLTPFLLQSGASSLSLNFTAGVVGTHELHYDISLTDGDFNDIHATATSTVTVSAVPEANPAMMLAAGLAVMALLARRRRA